MAKDKDKKHIFLDDVEWGNQETDTFTHEQLISPHATTIANNRARKGTKEWREITAKRKLHVRTPEEIAEASRRSKKLWQDPEYKKVQQEKYNNEWIETVTIANKNPKRNKKISKSNSKKIQTPDGIFKNAIEASNYYNITAEGIRHRIKTKDDWFFINNKKINRKPKTKKQNEQDRFKRLTAIAEKNGYIHTPYGKFLSVREAWREEQKHTKTGNNSHVWFKNANRDKPDQYFKGE